MLTPCERSKMRRGHQARIPVFLIMDVLRHRETPGAALSLRKGPRVRGLGLWGPASVKAPATPAEVQMQGTSGWPASREEAVP
jgi:hypothetical protein